MGQRYKNNDISIGQGLVYGYMAEKVIRDNYGNLSTHLRELFEPIQPTLACIDLIILKAYDHQLHKKHSGELDLLIYRFLRRAG